LSCGQNEGAVIIDLDEYRKKKKVPRKKRPRIVRLLKRARDFRRMLDTGVVASQADLARRFHVTRARVTQLLNLLRLAPDLQETLLSLPVGTSGRLVNERGLRQACELDHAAQRAAVRDMGVAL
jgi:hypothetical protein